MLQWAPHTLSEPSETACKTPLWISRAPLLPRPTEPPRSRGGWHLRCQPPSREVRRILKTRNEHARPLRHSRNSAAAVPVAADFHVHPDAAADHGLPRDAGLKRCSVGHGGADDVDDDPAGAGSHDPDVVTGRITGRPWPDVGRSRSRGA